MLVATGVVFLESTSYTFVILFVFLTASLPVQLQHTGVTNSLRLHSDLR